MKTFVRLIRRYVLAAVGIVLLLVFLGLGLLVFLGWQETTHLPQRPLAQRTPRKNGWTAMHGPWCWTIPEISGGVTLCRTR